MNTSFLNNFPKSSPGMYNYEKTEKTKNTNSCNLLLATIQDKLKLLMSKFTKVFEEPQSLPPSRAKNLNRNISLTEKYKIPNWRPVPQLNTFQLETLKKFIEANLDRGFISHSKSPFGACLLFAKKKDGSLRVCVDYRGLNAITIKDRTPLPNIKEMQNRLQGATIFSKIDLRDGYHNILIQPEDRNKTAFRTRYGHFEFNLMPFGLCNAPATFMRVMNNIFGKLYDECLICYMDDILIYSATPEEHITHLEKVFNLLHENKLFIKKEKCEFAISETTFCGTIVSTNGIKIDDSKIQQLFNMPRPKNIKDIQSFLGVHERELLALVNMCEKFKHLLIGKQFKAYTDHRALKYIQSQPSLNMRQLRWLEKLQDFDIAIEYLPGDC